MTLPEPTGAGSSTGSAAWRPDLRVSLTDRCNLRCTYCMPAEGLDWLPEPELLTDDEIVRLVGVAVARARRRPRSGSPAASRCCAAGWSSIVRARSPRCDAAPAASSLTTNGIGLARLRRRRWPTPGWTGSTSRLDTLDPRPVRRR